MKHLIRPNYDQTVILNVTPESAGWQTPSLSTGGAESRADLRGIDTEENEVALVPLSGRGVCTVAGRRFELARAGVFDRPAARPVRAAGPQHPG
jgi:5-deoxy-D-glucuronate isomerase